MSVNLCTGAYFARIISFDDAGLRYLLSVF